LVLLSGQLSNTRSQKVAVKLLMRRTFWWNRSFRSEPWCSELSYHYRMGLLKSRNGFLLLWWFRTLKEVQMNTQVCL
jgi:hypothetical protein